MNRQRVVTNPVQAATSLDLLGDSTDYWLAKGELPPALTTGHKLIDFEHRFLLASIANLRQVCIQHEPAEDCMACSGGQRHACESKLIAILGDIFAFILDHFKTEESVMRDSLLLMVDRDVCEAHMEDHAAISTVVQQIVASLDAQHTVSRIRELDALLTRWITHHIALHDIILTRWIERDDSVIPGR